MCVKLFPLFVIVFVCVFSVTAQKVLETETTLTVRDGQAIVRMPVENNRNPGAVSSVVELVNEMGNIAAKSSRSISLTSGNQVIEHTLSIADLLSEAEDLSWYRVRYQVGETRGIIAVSQIAGDLFELRIIAASNILSGMGYRVRVRATNPFTELPAAGVKIEVKLELELKGENDLKLELAGTSETDADGFAFIDFTIPPSADLDGDGEITVVGRKNGLVREADEDLNAARDDIQLLLMTDKPIYQPEQMLNVRSILLKGGESKTILADTPVEFRIEDEDSTLIYREKVKSSGFGIAAISWRIPANVKLGNYSIEVLDEDGDRIGWDAVRVSRYDLPNFVVNTKTLKTYYLPSDAQAEIEIRGDYLFGKPVAGGKVRVVEETSREWNFKEQKYEIEEGEKREGALDERGVYVARFDLAKYHEDLKDEDDRTHRDITFAAYLTDPTTNKTEQRRFDVRVSRDPIHVYLTEGHSDRNPELPITGYVSTFYPDGSPAECGIEIKASKDDAEKFKTVARIRTNAFGAGKFNLMRPKIGDPDDDLDFQIVATDKDGNRGMHTREDLSFDEDEQQIQIETDKTIYRPNESVNVSLRSTLKSGVVYVDVVDGWTVVGSYSTRLDAGKASISIPYKSSFAGSLAIAAFAEDPEDDDDLVKSTRGIIFPTARGLSVNAETERSVYKPNEEVNVQFTVADSVGKMLESALGIIIRDKAVEERARTDAGVGNSFRGLGSWLGYGNSFGGINVKDINDLDTTKPVSQDMQLVAEFVLHDTYYNPNLFRSDRYASEAKWAFGVSIRDQFKKVENALSSAYKERGYLHATDDDGLRRILNLYSIDLDTFFDPWEQKYRTAFAVEREKNLISIISAGPDKQFDTSDDFTAFSTSFEYFISTGKAIDLAIRKYHEATGKFVFNEKALFETLNVRELKDRFGRPYQISFDGDGSRLRMNIRSLGKDGKREPNDWGGDDFSIWTNWQAYFEPTEKLIRASQQATKTVPMSESAFRTQLLEAGVSDEMLRDGNGKPLYINADETWRYWDRVKTETVQVYGERNRVEKQTVTPVTQQIMRFTIRGPGKDAKAGTYDDVTFMQLVHVLSERAKDDPKPVQVMKQINYVVNTGSIAGKIVDPNGSAIPAVTVTATNDETGIIRIANSDASGNYLISNLAVGIYSVRAEAAGFQATIISRVRVNTGSIATVDIALSVGNVSEVVEVTSDASAINTTSSSSVTVNGSRSSQIAELPLNSRDSLKLMSLKPGVTLVTKSGERETPRVREYFPETLLWKPEVITDSNGKANITFRMADSITTWKMYTIASTKDGKIGFAEKELTAFQPFFVDLDPPKFLTEGDEIFLPTQVRNYTAKKQRVNVTMAKADWFSFIGAETQAIDVESGNSNNSVFGFKALTPVKAGKQRVTAIAETDSDAIERPVTVRPDGQEVVRTDSRVSRRSATFDLKFPATMLPRTQKAEVKIYPNLFAHVAESVDGLLARPYGCGEQTISSTYPNLMILKFAPENSSLRKKAEEFLQKGYERLVGYQIADGSFTYWGGKDAGDIALTAYALRFLNDARTFINVDETVIKRAEDWLIRQQRADGSWTKMYYLETAENPQRTKQTTTYVARSLSMRKDADKAALGRALHYLKLRNAEIDEPFALALYGLASLDSGDKQTASRIAEQLEKMAIEESGAAYWKLETNTPFYGWGTAARIETTALALQLLIRDAQVNGANSDTRKDLISKGTLFLIRSKDRYGVWYSTQTTINVLDAFLAALGDKRATEDQNIEVTLNGEVIQSLTVTPDKLDPVIVDLNGKLNADSNKVEVSSSNDVTLMSQVVASHYIDWKNADTSGAVVGGARALNLEYSCDKPMTAIMQEVNCAVRAERVGHQGYGMLLAEIGTPPGADVSRESLQAAIDNDWSISRYDVLPDRIIIYMWSKPGGTKFNFKFKPRYAINAQTPSSIVYDYYNPEAQATVAPLRFAVK